MSGIRCYTNWNKRSADINPKIEPFRKYIFVCEGQNTERWYFTRLIDLKKELGIHPMIDVQLMEKPEGEETNSHPKRLIDFANKLKADSTLRFDHKHDKIIIVFDVDVFKRGNKGEQYKKLIEEKGENIFAVTNPSFELFLLLHYEDAFKKHIKPYENEIIANKKKSKRRFIDRHFSSISKINPKENPRVGDLVENIQTEIKEESNINQNIDLALNAITSNVGKVINDIISETV